LDDELFGELSSNDKAVYLCPDCRFDLRREQMVFFVEILKGLDEGSFYDPVESE
jgi:hypothetical protein